MAMHGQGSKAPWITVPIGSLLVVVGIVTASRSNGGADPLVPLLVAAVGAVAAVAGVVRFLRTGGLGEPD